MKIKLLKWVGDKLCASLLLGITVSLLFTYQVQPLLARLATPPNYASQIKYERVEVFTDQSGMEYELPIEIPKSALPFESGEVIIHNIYWHEYEGTSLYIILKVTAGEEGGLGNFESGNLLRAVIKNKTKTEADIYIPKLSAYEKISLYTNVPGPQGLQFQYYDLGNGMVMLLGLTSIVDVSQVRIVAAGVVQ